MPPTSMGAARTASTGLMTQLATVYTADPVTGRWTTVLIRSLPCRLVHPTNTAPGSSGARAELLADRDLWWQGDISIPEQCRFLIDGVNFQPRAGTYAEVGDGATIVARRCAVVRQQISAF